MSERKHIDPELSKHIRKVKRARNAINKRLKLNSMLKHVDSRHEAQLVRAFGETFGKTLIDLCYAVTRDGNQMSYISELKEVARALHLADNFLREVPYAVVERERANFVKGSDVHASESPDFASLELQEAIKVINLLNLALMLLKVPAPYAEYKRLSRWVAGKTVVPVDDLPLILDANGTPVAI